MTSIIDKIKQPSTHAGIGLLFQVLSYIFPQYAPVLNSLTGMFASVAVVMNEKQGDVNVTVKPTNNQPVMVNTADPASVSPNTVITDTPNKSFNEQGG